MSCKSIQHMIKTSNAGMDICFPRTVKIQRQRDICLFCFSHLQRIIYLSRKAFCRAFKIGFKI